MPRRKASPLSPNGAEEATILGPVQEIEEEEYELVAVPPQGDPALAPPTDEALEQVREAVWGAPDIIDPTEGLTPAPPVSRSALDSPLAMLMRHDVLVARYEGASRLAGRYEALGHLRQEYLAVERAVFDPDAERGDAVLWSLVRLAGTIQRTVEDLEMGPRCSYPGCTQVLDAEEIDGAERWDSSDHFYDFLCRTHAQESVTLDLPDIDF